MALGALIGAYQEDDSGGLRALLPLAGKTLIEYQVRCVAAAGAAPIVVSVERVPQALQDAFERLRLDGIGVFPVSDVHEAVSRFEAGSTILLLGDGIAPSSQLVTAIAEEPEAVVATVPDDEVHEAFERIDAETRWAGIALVDSKTLGSTAAILGDWDLQSTLLRRTIQDGALRWHASEHGGEPLLAERPEQLEAFQRQLVQGSSDARRDWASRFLLPPVEDLATYQLMRTSIRPGWLVWGALLLTIGGAIAFWLIAVWWRHVPRTLGLNASVVSCTLLGAMFCDVVLQNATGYTLALAVLLGTIIALGSAERFEVRQTHRPVS